MLVFYLWEVFDIIHKCCRFSQCASSFRSIIQSSVHSFRVDLNLYSSLANYLPFQYYHLLWLPASPLRLRYPTIQLPRLSKSPSSCNTQPSFSLSSLSPRPPLLSFYLVATPPPQISEPAHQNGFSARSHWTQSHRRDILALRCCSCEEYVLYLPDSGLPSSNSWEIISYIKTGQQDALNPNIITNRICDLLTNVCAATAAGKSACLAAKAQIAALGTKDASTAAAWNAALGV